LTSDEERNAFILRRTLSAGSWLYSAWSGLLGLLAWNLRPGIGDLYDPRIIVLHAALLGLAGTLLWKPRRGAFFAVLAAAAGSIFFVVLDLRRQNVPAAVIDGAYVVLAAVLLYKSRRQA
jgi:hypothetical protein